MNDTLAENSENITQIGEIENVIVINCNEDNQNLEDDWKFVIIRGEKNKITHSVERLQLLKQKAKQNAIPTQN